jgi:hypothetical protein
LQAAQEISGTETTAVATAITSDPTTQPSVILPV